DEYKFHPAARATDENGNPREIGTSDFAIQLVADGAANAETLLLLNQLKLTPIQRQETNLDYVNVIIRLAPTAVNRVAARPDVVSIQPSYPRQKACERQDQIIAGNLAGSSPAGPGYLAWLASKGFTQSQFDAS